MEMGKEPFKCKGYVVRKWVGETRTFASLVVDVPGPRGGSKTDFRCFASGPMDDVAKLEPGQIVEVTASVDVECLRDKKKQDVLVDGFKKFVPCLTLVAIAVEASSEKPDDKIGW